MISYCKVPQSWQRQSEPKILQQNLVKCVVTESGHSKETTVMLQLKAVIFGAIGVIAETSDLQRQAFNLAFAEAGLDWHWDAETYRRLLSINGGQSRLRAYRDEDKSCSNVTEALIATLHERKTHHYGALTAAGKLTPRRGVAELIKSCQDADIRVALCTSTSVENVDAIKAALGDALDFSAFASITTIDKIARAKPAPDAYLHCLSQLELAADEVVAIEDTPVSMAAAIAAGISTIATPGAMTDHQDFSGAAIKIDDLAAVTLKQLDNVLGEYGHA
jgi:HAD superfamily hydrolase (TIGR01509 family)